MAHRRLLIIDDDSAIGRTIQLIAESVGMETRSTVDPSEFFHVVDEWDPTHIALDLVMPQMDGVEIITRLAGHGCKARIIITSGLGSKVLDAAARSAAEHGLDIIGVLPKPFTPSALREMLGGDEPATAEGRKSQEKHFEIGAGDLQQALETNQIFLVYQPKVRCQDGGLAGFEALARWSHPQYGIIPPDRFIPIAESSGLIDTMTYQLVDQALTWFSSHFGNSKSNSTTLSVNISPRTLSDAELVDNMLSHCHRHGVDPSRLIFEITETSAMEDPITSLGLLTRLRVKNFRLSIDDFGTGFSSMVQLVRLPFSEIKIDKTFVMTALQSEESRTVVRSIVDLGRSLALVSTAEGVENEQVLNYLREIGCDVAQGFFIGYPMTEEEAADWIKLRATE